MLCAFLNKSWKQNPTKQQLYSYLFSTSQTIHVKGPRQAGALLENNKDDLTMFYELLHMDTTVLADQQRLIYIRPVQTLDAV